MVALSIGILLGAIGLGLIHGVEPGHGWPVAASYALDRGNTWFYGLAASILLGIGHLLSSIAMVAAFFLAKSYVGLEQIDTPIALIDGVYLGGPVSLVAGLLLVALGVREYRHGQTHETFSANHGSHTHHHEHGEESSENQAGDEHSWVTRLREMIPFRDTDRTDDIDTATDRGLLGIAWVAFLLGFAHEEEFEIIALCAGSTVCLELMTAYAFAVIVGIVGVTLLLIAGYHRFEERMEHYTPYLPAVSATVLIVMGMGFITGIL